MPAGPSAPVASLHRCDRVGPTRNQIPPASASCAPSTALGRLALVSVSRPPSATTAPGRSDSQKRPDVMSKVRSGPMVKLRAGPMKGTRAPQAPRTTRSSPLTAPLLRGILTAPSPLRWKSVRDERYPAARGRMNASRKRDGRRLERVAVVIASDLAKDIAGSPLLRGASFKLERRD